MGAVLQAMKLLGSFHLLLYGSLLGSQLYQSFVMTKLCYLHLPMPQFTQLQKKVFPVYFRIQTTLALCVAATVPPASLLSVARSPSTMLPLGLILAPALLNLMVYGPKTSDAMMKRIHQETIDGRKYNDRENQSEEMKVCNRRFSKAHAGSIHFNLVSLVGTVWYGLKLASQLEFKA